eukprot:TRINITY_DN38860_c0_g1_i1.p1 TRINITY_DN38860_c0_g1~~TRINITY_DN38860_c0_g1_i1.p1  ORF type:complete len:450 (+),score=54.31 TRINITY_DN38860_c0_g1_i1:53-1351(+)
MQGPTICAYIDENCGVFEDTAENKLEYTVIHARYAEIVDEMLTTGLNGLAISEDQFVEFCEQCVRGERPIPGSAVEQLLSTEDFLCFKRLMLKRKAERSEQTAQASGALDSLLAKELLVLSSVPEPQAQPDGLIANQLTKGEAVDAASFRTADDESNQSAFGQTIKRCILPRDVTTPPSKSKGDENVTTPLNVLEPIQDREMTRIFNAAHSVPLHVSSIESSVSACNAERVLHKSIGTNDGSQVVVPKDAMITHKGNNGTTSVVSQIKASKATQASSEPEHLAAKDSRTLGVNQKEPFGKSQRDADGCVKLQQKVAANVVKAQAERTHSDFTHSSSQVRPTPAQIQERAEYWRNRRETLRKQQASVTTQMSQNSVTSSDPVRENSYERGRRLVSQLTLSADANALQPSAERTVALRQALTRQLRKTFEASAS